MVWKKITINVWYDEYTDTYQATGVPSHDTYPMRFHKNKGFPTKEKRKCGTCGAYLSMYNKGNFCAAHSGEGTKKQQKPKPKRAPKKSPPQKAPEPPVQPEATAEPQVDTNDRCKHDIIRATCSLCS